MDTAQLFSTTKIQILKAIHNTIKKALLQEKLFSTTKIQILKAIHNR